MGLKSVSGKLTDVLTLPRTTTKMSIRSDLSMCDDYPDATWYCWPRTVEVLHARYGLGPAPTLDQICTAISNATSPDDYPGFVLTSFHKMKSLETVDPIVLFEQSTTTIDKWIEASSNLTSQQVNEALRSSYELWEHHQGYSVLGRKPSNH